MLVQEPILDSTSGANGTISGLTKPDTNAVLNVDDYASTDASGARWGYPKSSGQSLSYWLQQTRNDPLLDERTTHDLPETADTVIIGSGITGTLVAKHHRETWPEKSVVVLEARDFCSGATGRNAGHCKPDQWRGFGKFEKVIGTEQAIKILKNEQTTWEMLVEYVRSNNVDCDLWVGDTLDVPTTPEVADIARDVFERYQAAGGKTDHIKVTHDPTEAARITRIRSAQACYAWPASTLQPRKLTAHVMRAAISNGVNLQTFTRVIKVSAATEEPYKWIVESDRGNIACHTVVHASNAYSAAVEPSLRGLIRPTVHMCNKVVPPKCFSGGKTLQNSYAVLLPNGALFSINPRCNSDGVIMFGGSNPGQLKFDDWVEEHPERCTDDGIAGVEGVTAEVKKFVDKDFEGWKEATPGPGQLYDYSWSGIIGRSADGVPFIGELPGLPGQWICAGHHGHGMARIFTLAPGLVKLMNGESWSSTGLPDVYQITQERVNRLRNVSTKSKVAVV